MKPTTKIIAALLLAAMLSLCATACSKKADTAALWKHATYPSDTALGEGANTVAVELVVGEHSVTLTLNTDKATLGEALFEHGLVNDPVFFDTCNGIKANWDKHKAYWSFYVDGEVALFGIGDAEAVTSGAPSYQIVYTQ